MFLRDVAADSQGKITPFSAEGTVALTFAHVGGLVVSPKTVSTSWILDLRGTTTANFFDNVSSWPLTGNLRLDGFVYHFDIDISVPRHADQRIAWVRRQGKANFATQPYEQLAKVLREDGDDAGARKVMIAMENDRLQSPTIGLWELFKGMVLRATIGYGYAPWRVLWYIAILLIAGTILFSHGPKRGWIISTEDHPERYKPFNPFIYSLETLLPLVDLYQAKHWIPDTETRGGKNLRLYLWGHTLFGWFLASMLIASVAGLVQK